MSLKMILGISLMIIGFISISVGFVFIKNAKSENIQVTENALELITEQNKETMTETKTAEIIATEVSKIEELTTENKISANAKQMKIAILDSLISIAVADGQLTNNEQKLLEEKAAELGLNYSDYTNQIEELLLSKQDCKETEIIDKSKEKGNNFEKYVVQKFSPKYFTIAEWAGDKYIKGKYAETTLHPDLKIRFKHNDISADFSVECKYRSNYYKNGIEWCSQRQMLNYKKFAVEKNMPVFVMIGVSGSAELPNDLYIIPLADINSIFMTKDFLAKYKKYNFKTNNFYFDTKTNTLK